jgi:uncharacterized damage-inducible protein DinB
MEARELMIKSLAESQGFLNRALEGLTREEIVWVPRVECNSIAFLVWHLGRVEDIWINRVIQQKEEIYEAEGWQKTLATPAKESGYKYTLEQLQAWPVPKLEPLWRYANSVREKTLAFLQSVNSEKLSEVIVHGDSSHTIGAILAHLITEIALHVGQIDYLRGMLRGMDRPDQRYW